ncbi:hypothetical protein IKF28_03130 [Candidatus Saccharibacteria bacterium]|nr:hypothetical protein [Candidatus Saccharibacteria bacterium]
MDKYSIRNRDGHLLCKVLSKDDSWYVQIKHRDCYTLLGLHPEGILSITESSKGGMNDEKAS